MDDFKKLVILVNDYAVCFLFALVIIATIVAASVGGGLYGFLGFVGGLLSGLVFAVLLSLIVGVWCVLTSILEELKKLNNKA